MAVEKLCPVLLRASATGQDILVFRHPLAGMQLVKGTRELEELIECGALRELAEESGIVDAKVVRRLGSSAEIAPGEVWHFLQVEAGSLADEWTFHTADGGGLRFLFCWWPLTQEPAFDWHPKFVRALHYIRGSLG